jgi:hypothetical protein
MQRYRMSAATYEMVKMGLVRQRVPVIIEITPTIALGTIYIDETGEEPIRDSEATGDDDASARQPG